MARCPAGQIDIDSTSRFRTRYLARIPASHTVEDVASPEYFGLVVPNFDMREGDLIEVEWEDFSRYGLLQVRAVERSLQLVTTKARIPISEDSDVGDLPAGWTMEFRGGPAGWAILCQGQQQEAGFTTPEKAANRIFFKATQERQASAVRTAATRGKAKAEAA